MRVDSELDRFMMTSTGQETPYDSYLIIREALIKYPNFEALNLLGTLLVWKRLKA